MEDINNKAVEDELNKSHSEAIEEIQNGDNGMTVKKAKEIEEKLNNKNVKGNGEVK